VRLLRKKDDRILSEKKVKKITRILRGVLRRNFPDIEEKWLRSAEETVRLQSMHIRFRSAREATGLPIKEVASRMKVPQY
jgi:hypothetical protein